MADYASNTFQYNGQRYAIVATFYNFIDGERKKSCALDILAMKRFEYVNELNNLLLTGSILYTDKYGIVDQFIEEPYPWCDIFLCEVEEQFDNSIAISKFSDTNKFQHTFLINNIEILNREKSIVDYRINLISSKLFNCMTNIEYSNYGGSPVPIFEILKICIAQAKLTPDISFDNVKTNVSLPYITTGNDNLFSVFEYLMRRLYYLEQRDDSLKFLMYNDQSDTYQLVDLKDSNSCPGSFAIVVSFFKSSAEHVAQQDPVNFGVVTKLPKSKMIPTLFHQDMSTFEYDSNQFGNTPFAEDENSVYFNNKFEVGTSTKPKIQTMPKVEGLTYKHYGSTWSNRVDFYHDYVQDLVDSNSLIVNAVADINRKPGSIVTIGVDRSTKDLEHDDPQSMDDLKRRYQTFEGAWIASKVRHIVEPNAGSGGNGQYRQNLVLVRNFLNETEKDGLETGGGNK